MMEMYFRRMEIMLDYDALSATEIQNQILLVGHKIEDLEQLLIEASGNDCELIGQELKQSRKYLKSLISKQSLVQHNAIDYIDLVNKILKSATESTKKSFQEEQLANAIFLIRKTNQLPIEILKNYFANV